VIALIATVLPWSCYRRNPVKWVDPDVSNEMEEVSSKVDDAIQSNKKKNKKKD
jgi:hypothetical protein